MNKKIFKITIPAIAAIIAIGGLFFAQQNSKVDQTSYHSIENPSTHAQTQAKPEFMDFYDPTFEQLIGLWSGDEVQR
ncbi:DUF6520 family protein [Paenibacillus herberti]|uniref:DUF6520 family protein n=1 Tax=Paenibacillus herberti TaxID=1619309 RepID=UPI001131AA6A|nr:DUF6520 family protein [Paenibacillus herberti]